MPVPRLTACYLCLAREHCVSEANRARSLVANSAQPDVAAPLPCFRLIQSGYIMQVSIVDASQADFDHKVYTHLVKDGCVIVRGAASPAVARRIVAELGPPAQDGQ
jgi:hypothetical protein